MWILVHAALKVNQTFSYIPRLRSMRWIHSVLFCFDLFWCLSGFTHSRLRHWNRASVGEATLRKMGQWISRILVRGIHRSPVNSPHKGQWRGALMFPLICAWINGCINNREAGDLRRYRAHYDVIVMTTDTPYLAPTGELWDVYWNEFGENWPPYNDTVLYRLYGPLNFECMVTVWLSEHDNFSIHTRP